MALSRQGCDAEEPEPVPSLSLEDGGRPIHLPSWRLHVGKAAGAGRGLGTPAVVSLPKPGSGFPGSLQRW